MTGINQEIISSCRKGKRRKPVSLLANLLEIGMNRFRKVNLSMENQTLVEQMQLINFGRIEGLPVRAGKPVWNEQTRVVRKIKLGGDNASRPEADLDDFELKREVIDLFEEIKKLGDGQILTLEIKHGLPFAMDVEEFAAVG